MKTKIKPFIGIGNKDLRGRIFIHLGDESAFRARRP